MAEITKSLFGIDPQEILAQRDAKLQQQALGFAQLDPMQQAQMGFYQAGGRIGGALGGLMGGEDPELQRAQANQQAMQGADFNSPQGLMALAQRVQSYNPAGALQLVQKAQEMRKRTAETSKIELGVQQEAALRAELAALPPNASPEQVMAVVTKYGDADKILSQLNLNANKAEDRAAKIQAAKEAAEAKVEAAKQAAEARVEAARLAGESRAMIAQMQTANARLIAEMQIQGRKDVAQLAASLKQDAAANKPAKPLHPSLQKQEDEDLNVINGMKAQIETLTPTLNALKPDPKTGEAVLNLGAINNLKSKGRNLMSASDPQSRAYAELERAVQQATNIKVSAEKGVQTDSDVLRMANELIAAYGKNDNKVMADSLEKYIGAIKTAEERRKRVLQKRRETQKVEPFIFDDSPSTGGADQWSIRPKQ